MVKPPQEDEIFCSVMIFFFLDSCFFPYAKKLLKASHHSVEEIQHESTTLRDQNSLLGSFSLLFCQNPLRMVVFTNVH